jgi:hypothetical protein
MAKKKQSAPAKRSVAEGLRAPKKSTTASTKSVAQALASSNKARAAQPLNETSNFSMMVRFFVTFFVVNTVVLYVANMVAPQAVVLGTNLLSPFQALLYSTGVFTLLSVAIVPLIEMAGNALRIKLEMFHWIAAYAALNTVCLWIVARFAEQLGLGISVWYVAVILGVILDFVQGFAIQMTSGQK